MHFLRITIAALLVGGSLVYVIFGAHKEIGILAGAAAVLASRYLIPGVRDAGRPPAGETSDKSSETESEA